MTTPNGVGAENGSTTWFVVLDGTLVLRTLLVKPFGPGKEADHAENQDHDDAHHEREDAGRILQEAVHQRSQRRVQRDHRVENCDFYRG